MIDAGASREDISEKTGVVLGCAGASLTVEKGEISVLMGLSGSGKSTLLRAVNRLQTNPNAARSSSMMATGRPMSSPAR